MHPGCGARYDLSEALLERFPVPRLLRPLSKVAESAEALAVTLPVMSVDSPPRQPQKRKKQLVVTYSSR